MTVASEEVLTDVRILVARLDERTKSIADKLEEHARSIDRKLDEAVISRKELDERLEPLTTHMERGKGALAAMTFAASVVGATLSWFFSNFFGRSG